MPGLQSGDRMYGSSWRASENPLLFDRAIKARKALYTMLCSDPDKFIEDHKPETTEANKCMQGYGTPGIDGKAEEVWNRSHLKFR